MSRRYHYRCQECGKAYESHYQRVGSRRCYEHSMEWMARVARMQKDPEFVARLKQLQSEFLNKES